MFLIMVTGILGNASIVYIILKNKLLRLQPTNLFLLNMAISDFLNLCICPILYLFRRDVIFANYYLGEFTCRVTPFFIGILNIYTGFKQRLFFRNEQISYRYLTIYCLY